MNSFTRKISGLLSDYENKSLVTTTIGTITLGGSFFAQIIGFRHTSSNYYQFLLTVIYAALLAMRVLILLHMAKCKENTKSLKRLHYICGTVFIALGTYITCFYVYVAFHPVGNRYPIWIIAIQLASFTINTVIQCSSIKKTKHNPEMRLSRMISTISTNIMFILAVNAIIELSDISMKYYVLEEGTLLLMALIGYSLYAFRKGKEVITQTKS